MTLRRISTFSRAKAPSQAETLGFTPTVDLLNQLPQQHRPVSAVVRGARKKKRVTALWAPRAGGEGALLAARQREKIEAVEARIDLTEDSGRLLIVLVGLPARGKSIVAEKLERFLAWRGWRTQAFSAGARRRAKLGAGSASFFAAKSDQAGAREQVAKLVLEEALAFFDSGGEIAILDASNCTLARRRSQAEAVAAHGAASGKQIALVCVECIVETPTLLLQNMLAKVRASPDFESTEQTAAMDDLRKRCEIYERTYEGCSEAEGPFIKLWDLGSRCAAYNVYGRMSATILPYILALHLRPRNIYLVSVPADAQGPKGKAAKELCARLGLWASRLDEPLHVICSTDATATEVASAVAQVSPGSDIKRRWALSPSDLGAAASLTSDTERAGSAGENTHDLVRRLEPIVLGIERSLKPVLVVSHQAPCRLLRAYLLGLPLAPSLHDDGTSAEVAALANGATAGSGAPCILALTPMAQKIKLQEQVVPLPCADAAVVLPAGQAAVKPGRSDSFVVKPIQATTSGALGSESDSGLSQLGRNLLFPPAAPSALPADAPAELGILEGEPFSRSKSDGALDSLERTSQMSADIDSPVLSDSFVVKTSSPSRRESKPVEGTAAAAVAVRRV